ncbi:MAG TPA: hypothetical protein VGI18_11075 [Burkholderiales bacterium]|jgi:hypothetical protein
MSARGCGLLAVALIGYAVPAAAYRPFDSTDADVAHAGEVDLELGPVQWLREGSKKSIEAPAAVFNLGFSKDRELVIETTREVARDPAPGEPGTALVDNGVFIKQVLRRGSLQDESGPSIAAEYGVLLPGVHAQDGTGVSINGIVSQRSQLGTVHFNATLASTREHESEAFLGMILEGPYGWRVRPVAEIFTDHATGSARVNSTLVGAIWRVRDGLSLDAGLRYARAGDEPIHELRLGLTWSFSLSKG